MKNNSNQTFNEYFTGYKYLTVTPKYQEGGELDTGNDLEAQVIELVRAAQGNDAKANEAKKQIQQIMEAAQQGDEQAQGIAQVIQDVIQKLTQSAKFGAKLNYIHKLRTGLNRDEEMIYYKCGGRLKRRIVRKT